MLTKLSVDNYALIDRLEVNLDSGFNVITGETGSGKSLLLGALGLLLGQNADFSKIGTADKKCVSEGVFDVSNYGLEPFFTKHDIDFEPFTIIRRELLKSGKSRAFINDTPVKLNVLKQLSSELIDIHSQHENSKIHTQDFLFDVLDTFSGASEEINSFRFQLKEHKSLAKDLAELKSKEIQLKQDKDYYEFQLRELSEIDLENIHLSDLEDELNLLVNAEEIRKQVYISAEALSSDNNGSLELLKQASDSLESVKFPDEELNLLKDRVISLKLELEDLAYEVRNKSDKITPDEERLAQVNDLVNSVNTLLLKHRTSSIEELLEKKENFSSLLNQAENFDNEIVALQNKINKGSKSLTGLSNKIHIKRISKKGELEEFINAGLKELSMPQAVFQVDLSVSEEFNHYGQTSIQFLVSTNKGAALSPISKVASGGEISRVMFLIKAAVASKKSIKTLVLDEIDTGISGEVASKLAGLIKGMSNHSQILVVSHLAQMASRANAHFKVSKQENETTTVTLLERLHRQEDVLNELAQMLSGTQITDAALKNAASLLSE
jgi:DNA repair protein RecN (Recombination protein N)